MTPLRLGALWAFPRVQWVRLRPLVESAAGLAQPPSSPPSIERRTLFRDERSLELSGRGPAPDAGADAVRGASCIRPDGSRYQTL